ASKVSPRHEDGSGCAEWCGKPRGQTHLRGLRAEPHKIGTPHSVQLGQVRESQRSSLLPRSQRSEDFLAVNGSYSASFKGLNSIFRLRSPECVDLRLMRLIQTGEQFVGELGSGFRGQGQS